MVGGEKQGFDKANAILQHMGKNVIHTGPVGTGQVRLLYSNKLSVILFLNKPCLNHFRLLKSATTCYWQSA